IEVGAVEARRIRNPVSDCHDDGSNGICGRFVHQPVTEHVFVKATSLVGTPLVLAKAVRQKTGLLADPLDALPLLEGSEAFGYELLEPGDPLRLAAKVIVEA